MNRELSWLKFNERVLEEAENKKVPLCERLNFAAIYQSNLDEFFMVRVGSLVDQMLLKKDIRDNKTNLTPEEQIKKILAEVGKLNRRRNVVYDEIMEELEEYDICITDFKKIFEIVKDQCDLIWLENLNLRGGFKGKIMDYIKEKHPDLYPLYENIYNKKDRSYFEELEKEAEQLAKDNDCPFVDNETPYGRAEKGHPVIVDYFYHEEVRGSNNTGKRNRK